MNPVIVLIVLLSASYTAAAEDTSPNNTQDPSQQDAPPLWIDETMESMVTPIKKWLDNAPEQNNNQQQKQHAVSIRSAIKTALKQYPGTVLSADKQSDYFAVKILSKFGAVKIINIPSISTNSKPTSPQASQ